MKPLVAGISNDCDGPTVFAVLTVVRVGRLGRWKEDCVCADNVVSRSRSRRELSFKGRASHFIIGFCARGRSLARSTVRAHWAYSACWGLRSYETAWAWLHKLRRAMIRPGRDCLSGDVEVDEAYVGGKEAGVRGRETVSKSIIAIAVELKQGDIGRIRLRRVDDVSAESLVGFVSDVVTPGSRVHTDGWSAYAGISEKGYKHQVTVVSASPDPAHVLMPNAHLVASLIKRWWLGTHQGATSKEHLDYYLDEFTFRFNRRTSKARGLLFYRLLENAVQLAPVSTDALFRGTGRGRRKRARFGRHKATSTKHRKLAG